MDTEQISIEPLKGEELREAAKVAARAMAPTPFPMALFQGQQDSERGMETLFGITFGRPPGKVLLAKKDDQVIGVMRMVEWPHCQLSLTQALWILPAMLVTLKGGAIRMLRGRSIWEKHHPKKPHYHLDPLAVAPEMQGQGIGSSLLRHFCEHVDQAKQAAYLGTDRPENVRLYERFGFSVIGKATALGVRIYFMWRPPPQDVH